MKTIQLTVWRVLLTAILAGANLCVRPHAAAAQTPSASDWSTPYETAAFSGPLELNDVYRSDRLLDANVCDPFNAASDPVFLSSTDFLTTSFSGLLRGFGSTGGAIDMAGPGDISTKDGMALALDAYEPLGDGLWFLLAFTAFYALLAVVIRNPRPWVGKIKKIITLQFINS